MFSSHSEACLQPLYQSSTPPLPRSPFTVCQSVFTGWSSVVVVRRHAAIAANVGLSPVTVLPLCPSSWPTTAIQHGPLHLYLVFLTNFTEQQQRQEICVGKWESNSVNRVGSGTEPCPIGQGYRVVLYRGRPQPCSVSPLPLQGYRDPPSPFSTGLSHVPGLKCGASSWQPYRSTAWASHLYLLQVGAPSLPTAAIQQQRREGERK
jgi:hypothetical protein